MDITTIGFDLAKTVFQVHGADGEGRAVLRRKLRRGKVLAFFAGLPSCLVGMEACAGAHYWARELQALGHEVRLIPPQYVRPFVKTNKNDAADAEAICEAVTRPTMRFAAVKSAEQQSVLMLHRARELLVRQRTMVINALRGHCAELGLIIAQGASKVEDLVAIIEDPGDVRLPPLAREALGSLVGQLRSAQAPDQAAGGDAFGMAPLQPGEPPSCDDPRRRCHHCDGAGRDDRRWHAVPLGPRALGLARSRAPAAFERRQGQAGADIEAWRWLHKALARAWCANRAALAPRQAGHASRLDRPTPGAAGRQTSCWSPWPIIPDSPDRLPV